MILQSYILAAWRHRPQLVHKINFRDWFWEGIYTDIPPVATPLATSTVPRQWKNASILPVPKIPSPLNHADFRPISITPVLCRTLERIVVREFLYPAILDPPIPLSFFDQYAFRPTGSTTAALIALLQTITDIMATDPFVIVIALDFSKAFDTVIDIMPYLARWPCWISQTQSIIGSWTFLLTANTAPYFKD